MQLCRNQWVDNCRFCTQVHTLLHHRICNSSPTFDFAWIHYAYEDFLNSFAVFALKPEQDLWSASILSEMYFYVYARTYKVLLVCTHMYLYRFWYSKYSYLLTHAKRTFIGFNLVLVVQKSQYLTGKLLSSSSDKDGVFSRPIPTMPEGGFEPGASDFDPRRPVGLAAAAAPPEFFSSSGRPTSKTPDWEEREGSGNRDHEDIERSCSEIGD